MTYDYNKEAFNEQVAFLKMLAEKLELPDYECLGDYLRSNRNSKSIDFLNKQLIEYINKGKLTNWIIYEIKNTSINRLEKNIDINYFWCCYWKRLASIGYVEVPSNFSDKENKKLKLVKRHCFENSVCDFHESEDEDDNGSTVFAYTETRRYM